MNDTVAGMIFLALIASVIMSTVFLVSEEKVLPIMYNQAQLLCDNNDGLKYYEYDNVDRGQAICNNGAKFNIMKEKLND